MRKQRKPSVRVNKYPRRDFGHLQKLSPQRWRYTNELDVYRVSQEECAILREGVPYVKLYQYNPKHLYPKLNGYGDNGKRSLKLWQLLHTYWLPNTYWNWQEYVVSVMLISVLNIKVTWEWHKAIKLNYKNTRTSVGFVLGLPSTLRRPRYLVTSELPCCETFAKVTALRALVVGHAHWMSMTSRTAPQKPTLFDGHYLRNRSTLDIGVWGYIGIV